MENRIGTSIDFQHFPDTYTTERLNDEELGNLLAGIGNHEAKAITLGLMKPGKIYSAGDLRRTIRNSQLGLEPWPFSRSLPFDYCKLSLEPIGLVAAEVISPELQTLGFVKTERGEQHGDALAGILLDFSLHYPNISIQDVFGRTQSTAPFNDANETFKKRSPQTRLKIIWEIITADLPLRVADIAERVGDDPALISTHLQDLHRKGILSYSSAGVGKPIVYYTLSESATTVPPKIETMHELSQFTFHLIIDSPSAKWTLEDIAKEAIRKGVTTMNEYGAKSYISKILLVFMQSGHIVRSRFHSNNRSDVNLTADQAGPLVELVGQLDNFQNGNLRTLGFGRRRLREILASPEDVRTLMEKAREFSPAARKKSEKERREEIFFIVYSSPNCTASDVQDQLNVTDNPLSQKSILTIIKALCSEGRIAFEEIKGQRHYYPLDEKEE